jgi:hypothetical protein
LRRETEMVAYRHFAGTTRLEKVGYRGPGKGEFVGIDPANPPTWNGKEWIGYVKVERQIRYATNPSKHECDGRCMAAKGFNCECACGGKNHGAGRFQCN